MKQNLMQKNLRLQVHTKYGTEYSLPQGTEIEDFTSTALFITSQLSETKYVFNKRTLVIYLKGKSINLQQPNNQHPPKALKGYMFLQQLQIIEQMIDTMIALNILTDQRIILKQKSTKRIFPVVNIKLNCFPKILVHVKQKKSSSQISNKKIQQIKFSQEGIKKSRLSIFLHQKHVLPVNVEKKQIQEKIKTLKQEQLQRQQQQRIQLQMKMQKQKQMRQIQLKKHAQQKIIRKQRQRQNNQARMKNFWLQQKQKIESFVMTNTKTYTSTHQLELAGNMLQMQMKQLKEKQQQIKNPIKPLITWSFMKNTLGIDGSQSQNEQKRSVRKGKLKNQSINRDEHRISIKRAEILQEVYCVDLDSRSTEITRTNYGLKKVEKLSFQKKSLQQQRNQIFAKSSKQSMFESPYYISGRRTTQTISNRKSNRICRQVDAGQTSIQKNETTFKRKTPLLSPEQNQEIQFSVTKKPSKRSSSLSESGFIAVKSHNHIEVINRQSYFKTKKSAQFDTEIISTRTLALPKKLTSRKSSRQIQDHDDRSQSNEPDTSSQTKTTPEPKVKSIKTCTKDLDGFTGSKSKQQMIKRDSFIEELITEYCKKR